MARNESTRQKSESQFGAQPERTAEPSAGAKANRIKADTARYEALAREHGADLSEEGFNEALRKVGRKA